MTYDEMIQELMECIAPYGIELTDLQKDKLIRHLMMVIEKNESLNLTHITNPEDAIILHILDSLLMAEQVNEAPIGRFMDIGTGGGFPGIPLVIATGRKAVLVDSVAKKVDAVNEFIGDLSLRTRAVARAGRVEEIAQHEKGTYTAVVARAVAPMSTLIEYASPLLHMRGRLVVTKGNPTDEELDAAAEAASICGFEPIDFQSFELPHGLGHREIFSYKRVRYSKIALPRRVGVAQHHPLGY